MIDPFLRAGSSRLKRTLIRPRRLIINPANSTPLSYSHLNLSTVKPPQQQILAENFQILEWAQLYQNQERA